MTWLSDKNKRVLFSAVWGYLALIGVVKYIKIGIADRNFSNNLIYFSLYFMITALVFISAQYIEKKRAVYSACLAIFFAGIFVVGAQIEYLEVISWTAATALKILLLAAFLFPLFILLFYAATEYEPKELEWKTAFWKKWRIYLIIVFFWGIAYLALFPGIYDYDSIAQTLQFLVTGQISAHHPVIHSFLLSAFLELGKVVFDSYEIGLGIYSLFQLLFLAYAAMQISWRLLKKNHKRLFIFSILFFALFPVHYIMAVWATKDVIFTALFVLVSLEMTDMIDNSSGFWESKSRLIRFVVLTVLMCAFRNNGVYALLLLIPICFFCFKEKRGRVILLLVISIGIYFGYQNVLLPAAGVVPGNMREMMSVPCQQLAKVYVENPSVYTEEEKQTLFELIPEDNIMDYQYRPMIADATKNYFNSEAFQSNPGKYVKLYISIGLKSPRKYIEAFLQNSCGFWYPNKSYPDERMYHPYMEFDMADPDLFGGDYIYLERQSLFPLYESVLKKIISDTAWEHLPLASNFFVPGTYFAVLVFAVVVCFCKKNYRQLLILGFWGGLWFTLLISPVALIRYAYPVVFCLPVMLSFICEEGQKKFIPRKKQKKSIQRGIQNG